MIMRRIIEIISVCLIGTFAAAATAQEQNWKTVNLSAFGGHVLAYDQPGDWYNTKEYFDNRTFVFRKGERGKTVDRRSASSVFGKLNPLNKRIGFTNGSKYSFAGEAKFHITQYNLPRPVTVDRWVENQFWRRLTNDYDMIVYGEGTTEILGKTAIYYLSSRRTRWINDKEVPATGPTEKN